jgi:hypothetical protein
MDNYFYRDVNGKWWIGEGAALQELKPDSGFVRTLDDIDSPTRVTIENKIYGTFYLLNILITEIKDRDGNFYADFASFEKGTGDFISENKSESKDRTSPLIIIPMAQEIAATILDVETVIDDYTIDVVNSTGFVIGQHIRIIDSGSDRFYQGTVLLVATNTITLDNQIDFEYTAGSQVIVATIKMNVNGSGTPQIFKHRLGTPSTPSVTNISRMIVTCVTTDPITLTKFGDLTALGRGLLFRKTGSEQINIFNIKNNRDMKALAFDFDPSAELNPAQGENGFVTRLTFTKVGAAIELKQFENLEAVVQDAIQGLLSFQIMLGGYRVE